jgi:hypothetical protein
VFIDKNYKQKTQYFCFLNLENFFSQSKNSEHGEKKHLSKLQFVQNVESEYESRELKTRLNLEDGCYVVVPYCRTSGHDGEYLLRIIGEKDLLENKNGWYVKI